jgi:quercetin dioxygenase-like cupin family protein
MKAVYLTIVALSFSAISFAQDIIHTKSETPDKEYENILVHTLSDDENQTSFMIWIKNGVKLHKHLEHTENIYVLKGKGEMTIGDEKLVIKKGDYFSIKKNTPHALKVLSSSPMKVISIQSPKFIGKDRIFINEE